MQSATCCICNWTGDSFLPRFRTGGRLCVCPSCRSLDRNRHLFDALNRAGLPGEEQSVLDVAPSIAILRQLATRCAYVAVDYAPTSPNVMPGDLRRLPFADQTFDVVLCSHVLEHVRDDSAAMREVARVLRPSGRAFVQVPYTRSGATEEFVEMDKHGHVRNYDREDFVSRLVAAGLRVEAVNYASRDGEQIVNDHLDVFICTVPDAVDRAPVLDFVRQLNGMLYRDVASAGTGMRDIRHKPIST